MMRLPWFRFLSPSRIDEAAKILAGEGPRARPIAGGTDLLPNMKRRHQLPEVLVSLRRIEELRRVENGSGLRLGAGRTLTELVRDRLRVLSLNEVASWANSAGDIIWFLAELMRDSMRAGGQFFSLRSHRLRVSLMAALRSV